jgi:hypothetical protein
MKTVVVVPLMAWYTTHAQKSDFAGFLNNPLIEKPVFSGFGESMFSSL